MESWDRWTFWKVISLGGLSLDVNDCTKEPQDMMVGVRFTYSADHFEGWLLGMESAKFWFATVNWVSRIWWCGKFCSMLLEDSKKQDALVRVRCLVFFFFKHLKRTCFEEKLTNFWLFKVLWRSRWEWWFGCNWIHETSLFMASLSFWSLPRWSEAWLICMSF